jgi:hypothetical protein
VLRNRVGSRSRLGADEARMPVSNALDTTVFPAGSLTLVDAASSPVACAQWTKPVAAATSSLRLLSGAALPVPDGRPPVALDTGAGAARAYLEPGIGYLVATVGQQPAAPQAGSLFCSTPGLRHRRRIGRWTAKVIAALGCSPRSVSVVGVDVVRRRPRTAAADALTRGRGR